MSYMFVKWSLLFDGRLNWPKQHVGSNGWKSPILDLNSPPPKVLNHLWNFLLHNHMINVFGHPDITGRKLCTFEDFALV